MLHVTMVISILRSVTAALWQDRTARIIIIIIFVYIDWVCGYAVMWRMLIQWL